MQSSGNKGIGKSLFNMLVFFFQAEDGIRDAQESRGLGDVYKRQVLILFIKRKPFSNIKACILPNSSIL